MDKLILPTNAHKLAGLPCPEAIEPDPVREMHQLAGDIARAFPHLQDKARAAADAFEAHQNRN